MYIIIWEFAVRAGQTEKFESIYGKDGDWVTLFKTAHGYVKIELFKDMQRKNRYLTIDYWMSEQEYELFRQTYTKEYSRIDSCCVGLTEEERLCGRYSIVSA